MARKAGGLFCEKLKQRFRDKVAFLTPAEPPKDFVCRDASF